MLFDLSSLLHKMFHFSVLFIKSNVREPGDDIRGLCFETV